jgi:hypothetical protein
VQKPTFAAPGDPVALTFELRVYDSRGQADLLPDATVVTVNNQPPISYAGLDQTRVINTLVTLDGTGSVDPDYDTPLTYFWTQTGGPTVALQNATTATPSFTAPDTPAVLRFALFVSDALGEPDSTPDSVSITIREPFFAHLPVVAQRFASVPDLIVQSITARSNSIQLVIANQGSAPVLDEFWVDAYINPGVAPSQVNQPWYDIAAEGLVWGVSGSGLSALAPGGTLTLSVGDQYFYGDYSQVKWPLSVGTRVYAQVDSFNPATTYGTVLETHELLGGAYNNILGPVTSIAGTLAEVVPLGSAQGPLPLGNLPRRP